jgi:uncharacterized membrane protein
MVKVKRHIAKTISYRIISSLFGFFTMWYLTGDIRIGTAFSVVEMVIKPIIYFAHERIWYRYIKYGLKNQKNNTILK